VEGSTPAQTWFETCFQGSGQTPSIQAKIGCKINGASHGGRSVGTGWRLSPQAVHSML
jgi:hypothetical protein